MALLGSLAQCQNKINVYLKPLTAWHVVASIQCIETLGSVRGHGDFVMSNHQYVISDQAWTLHHRGLTRDIGRCYVYASGGPSEQHSMSNS